MNSLSQKKIVITGGSGLLGKAIVEKLVDEGATAINLDIQPGTKTRGEYMHCDVTDPESIQKSIHAVIQKYGRIDGLVNNAYPRTDDWGEIFEKVSVESWRKNVDMQLNSCFEFCKVVCEQMKKQQHGAIINMGSMYGVTAPDFSIYEGTTMTSPAAYSAIKGGTIHFTKYLASYFGKFGIRVNCVSPGGIFDHQNETFVKNYERKVPLKRMGLPGDIAGPIAFLLSDESAYITGHNLVVDGGWTII
jgi:NAD(P)-dependent dehydrogenase (short-subunit alcohol dehydrogenase family)